MPKFFELFAGAGGMTMGLEAAGWECVGHAEIEPHARAVLRHKWPDVPLHGDVTQLDGTTLPPFDLLTFGAPCQDLSIAGKRAGMEEGSGTRSSLFFDAIRIWKQSSAPLALYENVLGAFSSNHGKDFAAVLSAFVGAAVPVPADGWRGAGVASGPAGIAAWRTVDAQHFGWDGDTTPQRRRRVFVLGTRTGVCDPAEVLLVADGLLGHLAASGEAGEGAAEDAVDGTHGSSLPTGFGTTGSVGYVHDIMPSLPHLTGLNCPGAQMMGVLSNASVDGESRGAIAFKSGQSEAAGGTFVTDYAPTLQGAANGSTMVPAVLTYDARGNGEGVGVPFRMTAIGEYTTGEVGSTLKAVDHKEPKDLVVAITQYGGVAGSLTARADGSPCSDRGPWQSGGDVRLEPRTEQANTLQANQTQAVILRNREGKGGGGKGPLLSAEREGTLGTSNDQVVFSRQVVHPTLMTDHYGKHSGCNQHVTELATILPAIGVPRRLMPVECERLMGWPDAHTATGTDEQGRVYALSDTARYKLCGNGCVSPVLAWIGLNLRRAIDSAATGRQS